jgi:hypothetical protein
MPTNTTGGAAASKAAPTTAPSTTPLLRPTNVTADGSGTTITVNWKDPNVPANAANIAGYAVSFVPKDPSLASYPATPVIVAAGTTTKDFTPAATDPTVATLTSNYLAQVVVQSKDATKFGNSEPGVQTHWDVNLSIGITLGGDAITLSKPATSSSGIYRIDDTYQITLDQIRSFLNGIDSGMGDKLPSKWPDGSPISGELDITKLVVDIDNKLFALGIKVPINFTPINGLTVSAVELDIAYTDGTNL